MQNRTLKRIARHGILALAAASAMQSVSKGQTWQGASGGVWATPSNWLGGVAPSSSAGTANIIFANNANTGNSFLDNGSSVNWNIASLTFNTTASAWTIRNSINGTSLTIGSSGITDNSASQQSINAPIVLGASQTWNVTNGKFDITGTINLQSFTISAAQGTSVSAQTTFGGTISGTGGITQSGMGTVVLQGSNSYSGATTINSGDLELINNAGALGGTSGVSLAGGTLQLNPGITIINYASSAITVTAGSQIDLDNASGASSQYTLNSLKIGSNPQYLGHHRE